MAKYRQPFKKPGSGSTLELCTNCYDNGYHREVEQMTLYQSRDNDLLYEDNNHHYFTEGPVEMTGYWCGRCENFSEEYKEETEAIWVCAHCKGEWDTEDEANGCCNDED